MADDKSEKPVADNVSTPATGTDASPSDKKSLGQKRGKEENASEPATAPADDEEEAEELSPEQEHALHQEASQGEPQIDVSVYVARHQLKPDQLAGFAAIARVQHQGQRTVAEWDRLLEAFNQRVTG